MNRTAIICFLLFANAFSQKTADFIILTRPPDYTILNQYQQPFTDAEKKLFVPYSPLRIENDEEVLGDQITRALKVVFDGKPWFLQKDESGGLLGDKGRQNRPLYKNCVILNDTVKIVSDRAVSFSEKFPPAGQAGFLAKGEIVVRLFSYGGFCCVKRTAAQARYGWSSFAQKTAWKRVEQEVEKPQGLTGFLSDRIARRFADANKTYKEYFDHFNAFTHQEKSVPAWRCEVRGNQVHCSLNAPYNASSQLDESTQYLVRDLENMLIGKRYDVVPDKGEITIRPVSEGEAGR